MTQRVTVHVTRTRGRRRRPNDTRADPGTERVRTLIRRQARLALATSAIIFLLLGGLPLLFAAFPGLSHVRVLGIRLPWLILCGGVQPIWVIAARRHVRLAERAERDFTDQERHE